MIHSKISALKNGKYKVNGVYLFDTIEIFSVAENPKYKIYKFLKIPILKIKKSAQKKEYKLLLFIHILKNNEENINLYKYLDKQYLKVKKKT